MCVLLNLNKVLMYRLHYDYINKKYGNKSRLLFTDNDSLMYEVKTEDVYEDVRREEEMFNFSNYLKYYDYSNKLVLGNLVAKISHN